MEPQKPQPAQPPAQQPASEYEAERRRKRQELRALGVNPYGQRASGVTPIAEVRGAGEAQGGVAARASGESAPSEAAPELEEFTVAGRVMLKRDMGKLSFLTIRDETGDLQVALQKNKLDETAWEIRNRLDLGDLIVATGPLGTTKTGELTIWATQLHLSAKSLLVPPEKHKGLEDVELRYRRRYVDLWSNPAAMRIAQLRIQIVERMRRFWREKGFLEVETPMLQPLHGGAAARPFVTHMNALDMNLYLRIAPELYLKRLLVGGFRKVFEINRNFRNEGISPRHNPEFTMLEAYEAYGSWETMAALVEEMICTIAQEVAGQINELSRVRIDNGILRIEDEERFFRRTIDLRGDESKPVGLRWPRVRMADIVEEYTGWWFSQHDSDPMPPPTVLQSIFDREYFDNVAFQQFLRIGPERVAQIVEEELKLQGPPSHEDLVRLHVRLYGEAGVRDIERAREQFDTKFRQMTPAERLVTVYEKGVEPKLANPHFVTHVPSVIIPLARPSEDDSYFAEVYELAINGQEISPGYTELNDPDVQEQLFRAQVGDEAERQQIDEDFLTALKYGMPPAGGMGLGVDRLVAMLTGAPSLRDVILFPLMRPRQE